MNKPYDLSCDSCKWAIKYIAAIALVGFVNVFDRMLNADILSWSMLLMLFIYSVAKILACMWSFRSDQKCILRVGVILATFLFLSYFKALKYFDYVNLAIFDSYYSDGVRKTGHAAEAFTWGGGSDPVYLIHFRAPPSEELTGDAWKELLFPTFSECFYSLRELTPTYFVVQFVC